MAYEADIGKGILDHLYPPPLPAYRTDPAAFGELVHARTSGPPAWERARHIDVMNEAIVRTINKDEGRLMIAVSVRHGKALDVDTPIPTPGGWVPIGDLKEGDEVFDERGMPCRVLHAFAPYSTTEAYELRMADGSRLVADAPHQWAAYSYRQSQNLGARRRRKRELHRSWPEDWGTSAPTWTTDQMRDDGGRFYIPTTAPLDLPAADLPLDPYILGFWLGDGTSRQNTVTASKEDHPFLVEQFRLRGASLTPTDWGAGLTLKVEATGSGRTSPFADTLRRMGVWGRKAVPSAYLRASIEQRKDLLAGLMDSDGGFEASKRNTGRVSFTSQSRDLADAVAELFTSLGAKVTRDERPAKIGPRPTGATAYRVSCSPPFNPFTLPRKACRWSDDSKGSLTRRTRVVEAITPVEGRTVRCISVDSPSHLYLAGEAMVPTHNSMFGSRIVPAWYLGNNPDDRVLLAGHEADFASRHGRAARDMLTEKGDLFGIQIDPRSEAANRWDLKGHEGGMLTLGVGGSPIGRGGNLVIVDDPYKNFADAMNPNVRKKVLEWWTGTMVSRIEPGGSVIIIMARWHKDDLIGVLSREEDDWEVLTMPALCTDPATDPLGRELNEALWPERYPVPVLEKRKQSVSITNGLVVWEAQFQQDPHAANGSFFKDETWAYYTSLPELGKVCRAWDLAASENAGDWTVGVLMAEAKGGKRWYVLDVVRERTSNPRDLVKKTAVQDKMRWGQVLIELPQDPAQAGKDQAAQMVTDLAGFTVRAIPQSGSKQVRAGGVSSQQQVGNIFLPEDMAAIMDGGKKGQTPSWVGVLVQECGEFDTGVHDDQVDALSGAYNRLVGRGARLLV